VMRIPNGALRFRPEEKTTTSPEERAASLGAGGGTAAVSRQVDQSRSGGGSGRGGAGGGGAGGSGAGGGRRGKGGPPTEQTVYKLPPAKVEPDPVKIQTGISDGRLTQVVSGQLAVGDSVVTGVATTKVDSTGSALPGGGRSPAGGGGGRRGP
jgi:HlyD family secretion protein